MNFNNKGKYFFAASGLAYGDSHLVREWELRRHFIHLAFILKFTCTTGCEAGVGRGFLNIARRQMQPIDIGHSRRKGRKIYFKDCDEARLIDPERVSSDLLEAASEPVGRDFLRPRAVSQALTCVVVTVIFWVSITLLTGK